MIDTNALKAALSLSALMEKDGHELRNASGNLKCLCPFHEERSPSFTIFEDYRYKCFGCGAGGDVFTYYMATRTVQFATAIRELAQMFGISPDPAPVSPLNLKRKPRQEQPLEPVAPIPEDLAARFEDGIAYLLAHEDVQAKIAEWRGWPVAAVVALSQAGLIAVPTLFHPEAERRVRVVAFPVCAPNGAGQRLVGVHFRRFPTGEAGHAPWFFYPARCKEKQRPGVPALPLVLGNFAAAKLIVAVEGEWDALTLAIAEGWIGEGVSIPEGLALVGVRAASGINIFLRHWEAAWPKGAEALLICDGDAAGNLWRQRRVLKGGKVSDEPSFLEKVRARCARAGAIATSDPHKDLNDAYRAEAWPPGSLSRALTAAGFTQDLLK